MSRIAKRVLIGGAAAAGLVVVVTMWASASAPKGVQTSCTVSSSQIVTVSMTNDTGKAVEFNAIYLQLLNGGDVVGKPIMFPGGAGFILQPGAGENFTESTAQLNTPAGTPWSPEPDACTASRGNDPLRFLG